MWKANALLQAHFSRQVVGGNLGSDQHEVLLSASRLLQAMVDVISSNSWLTLALLAMEGQGFTEVPLACIISDNFRSGDNIALMVTIERDLEGRTEVGPVDAPRYPKTKEEGWWLVVGDTKSNQLLAIKRFSLQRKVKVKLDGTVPSEAGKKNFMLYFMCDSYTGCDQEYGFSVDVKQASPDDDSGKE
ncbi:DExH-box ATP-dependent RNA helicase DExH12-like protein [Tanacetum coccineum]